MNSYISVESTSLKINKQNPMLKNSTYSEIVKIIISKSYFSTLNFKPHIFKLKKKLKKQRELLLTCVKAINLITRYHYHHQSNTNNFMSSRNLKLSSPVSYGC